MAAPIALREDFDGLALRGLAKKTRDADQSRRLLALAEIYDAGSRGQAARIGGVGLAADRSGAVVWEEYRIRIAKQTLSRQLRAMGFRKLSARPWHRATTSTPPRRLEKLPGLLAQIESR
jgi:hypothetical protein